MSYPSVTVLSIERLVAYLSACGGVDRFEFFDDAGQADTLAARRLAEDLRGHLGPNLDVIASVEQNVNRVSLTLLVEPVTV